MSKNKVKVPAIKDSFLPERKYKDDYFKKSTKY